MIRRRASGGGSGRNIPGAHPARQSMLDCEQGLGEDLRNDRSRRGSDLLRKPDRSGAWLPIGGLIGDAMGTPSEGLEPDEIDAGFGWIEDFEGDGTDDSIMKYLLADALLATDGNADADFWATQWLSQRSRIGGAMSDRFFASILHGAAKLSYGVLPRRVALGHMPSSTAAMSIAPVGIVNAGHPRAATAQTQEDRQPGSRR